MVAAELMFMALAQLGFESKRGTGRLAAQLAIPTGVALTVGIAIAWFGPHAVAIGAAVVYILVSAVALNRLLRGMRQQLPQLGRAEGPVAVVAGGAGT